MMLNLFTALLLSFAAANAEPSSVQSTIKVQVTSGAKSLRVFGRAVPDVGSLQVQLSDVRGRVQSVLVQLGEKVGRGAPLMKYTGAGCSLKPACVVHSSFEGVVDEILKGAGSSVQPGEGLVSVLNPLGLAVRLDVPARYIKFLNVGQVLTVRGSSFDAGPPTVEAQIVEIQNSLGIGETTRGVRLNLLRPLKGLRQESVVTADVLIPLSGSGTKVPAEAVAYRNGSQYVIKKSGESLTAVPVHILSESADSLWIGFTPDTPLKSGDSILSRNAIFYLSKAMNQRTD
jgi:multidrug efflux pump subunit AcrA (membrane-fusion protein)